MQSQLFTKKGKMRAHVKRDLKAKMAGTPSQAVLSVQGVHELKDKITDAEAVSLLLYNMCLDDLFDMLSDHESTNEVAKAMFEWLDSEGIERCDVLETDG